MHCNQFYIENRGQYHGISGEDINISQIIKDNYTKKQDIYITVNDNALLTSHVTIRGKVETKFCKNFETGKIETGTKNKLNIDGHGTSVTGIIAGSENNEKCFTGIAKNAKIIFNVIVFDSLKPSDIANAFTANLNKVDIQSNSWSFEQCVRTNDESDSDENGACHVHQSKEIIFDAIERTSKGRKGKGQVIVFSAGNDGYFYGDTNYQTYINHRFCIIVAASTNRGERCYYSNRGTSIFVNAPSSLTRDKETQLILEKHENRTPYIIAPSADNDYSFNTKFGGTSAAAPQVAGIVALMLEENPNLTRRDVHYILIYTSTKNDPTHYSWITNAAGISYSSFYGFGRINGGEAIQLAKEWNIHLPSEKVAKGNKTVFVNISSDEYIIKIDIKEALFIESIQLQLEIDTCHYSHMLVFIESPQKTIATPKIIGHVIETRGSKAYNYMIRSFFGENSKGEWKIIIKNNNFRMKKNIIFCNINVYGTNESTYVQRRNHIPRNNCNSCKNFGLIFPEFVEAGKTAKIYLNVNLKKGEKKDIQFYVQDNEKTNQILIKQAQITPQTEYIDITIPTLFEDSFNATFFVDSVFDDCFSSTSTIIRHEKQNDTMKRIRFTHWTFTYHEYHNNTAFSSHVSVTVINKRTRIVSSQVVEKNTGIVDVRIPLFDDHDVFITCFDAKNMNDYMLHEFHIKQHTFLFVLIMTILSFIFFCTLLILFKKMRLNQFTEERVPFLG